MSVQSGRSPAGTAILAQINIMKELSKILIAFLIGCVLGFAGQAAARIGFRKIQTGNFLAEARSQVMGLRAKVAAFHAEKGRFPKDPAEMLAAGFWRVEAPPVERLRGSGRWSTRYDGEGGFVYLSATGQIYLNTNLTREKLLRSDIQALKQGDLLPPGAFF